jgi:hypothetical protein
MALEERVLTGKWLRLTSVSVLAAVPARHCHCSPAFFSSMFRFVVVDDR